MAVCGKIKKGQDNTCGDGIVKGYIQEAVIINFSDVKSKGVDVDCDSDKYQAKMVLENSTTGYAFEAMPAGTVIRGWTSKTRDDNGYPVYTHNVQIVITGVTQEQKCILSGLDKGLYVVALKLKKYDDTSGGLVEAVEIYGLGNGMTTADYDYNIVEEGGVVPITLSSLEGQEEADLPYIYASGTPGDEAEDFDARFAP